MFWHATRPATFGRNHGLFYKGYGPFSEKQRLDCHLRSPTDKEGREDSLVRQPQRNFSKFWDFYESGELRAWTRENLMLRPGALFSSATTVIAPTSNLDLERNCNGPSYHLRSPPLP